MESGSSEEGAEGRTGEARVVAADRGRRADSGPRAPLGDDGTNPPARISVRVIAASAVAGLTRESRRARLASALGVPTSRVRPPPPPRPTPTGARPPSTPTRVVASNPESESNPAIGSFLGAADVPKPARTEGDATLRAGLRGGPEDGDRLAHPPPSVDLREPASNPEPASSSALVASLLAALVLFASCVRRFATTAGRDAR